MDFYVNSFFKKAVKESNTCFTQKSMAKISSPILHFGIKFCNFHLIEFSPQLANLDS